MTVITIILFGLLCLAFCMYCSHWWPVYEMYPRMIEKDFWNVKLPITIMSILFWISFLWFVWIWTRKEWIRKSLSLLVCSTALACLFFWMIKIYHLGLYRYFWKSLAEIMTVISVVSFVTFLLLLIRKKSKEKPNKIEAKNAEK